MTHKQQKPKKVFKCCCGFFCHTETVVSESLLTMLIAGSFRNPLSLSTNQEVCFSSYFRYYQLIQLSWDVQPGSALIVQPYNFQFPVSSLLVLRPWHLRSSLVTLQVSYLCTLKACKPRRATSGPVDRSHWTMVSVFVTKVLSSRFRHINCPYLRVSRSQAVAATHRR